MREFAEFVSPEGLIDAYHMENNVGRIPAGKKIEVSFTANFQVQYHRWDRTTSFQNAQFTLPRISRLGTANAWIIARLEDSPILNIDEQRTEFVPHQEMHLFVQEILPEDMSAAAALLLPDPSSAP